MLSAALVTTETVPSVIFPLYGLRDRGTGLLSLSFCSLYLAGTVNLSLCPLCPPVPSNFTPKFSTDLNQVLYNECKQYDADNYSLEVLEYLDPDEDNPDNNADQALDNLIQIWLTKLRSETHSIKFLS